MRIFCSAAILLLAACSSPADSGKDANKDTGEDTNIDTGEVSHKEDNMISNITIESGNDFAATESKLLQAIEEKGLKLFTVIDHGAGAKSVDQDIGQSKVFIFGNPKVGSPLMAENIQMGLELPLKILITSDADDSVTISYTDIKAIAKDYGVTGKDELLGKISGNLNDLALAASKP